jgi:hypothetical protein
MGPRQSFKYQKGKELEILKAFPGKTSLWELLVYFESDFLIIPTLVASPWLDTLIKSPGYVDALNNSTRFIVDPNQNEFDFSAYDLVITHDPVLSPYLKELKLKHPKTLFAYILAEHTSWVMHQQSLEYDLYLDHTLNSVDKIVRLPQSANFLFPRIPKKLKQLFPVEKTSIFFDYRSIGYFISQGKSNVSLNLKEVNEFISTLKSPLQIEPISETSLKPYMFSVENNNDSVDYYSKLTRSKYFVSIANRVGQAAFDAASAGALVIGNNNSSLHKKICYDFCLLKEPFNVDSVLDLISKLESNPMLYKTALEHQQKVLNSLCVDHPKNIILESLKLK